MPDHDVSSRAPESNDDAREIWAAYANDRSSRASKLALVRHLRDEPESLEADRVELFLALLGDETVSPDTIAPAGWRFLIRTDGLTSRSHSDLAARLERDPLARSLLSCTQVNDLDAEVALTALRRWLVLDGQWETFPRLCDALRMQAVLNEGAWLISEDEARWLESHNGHPVAAIYEPPASTRRERNDLDDPVTRNVAEQYESWPYPTWQRINYPLPQRLSDLVRQMDPEHAVEFPERPEFLIPGCGTGRQAAHVALLCPEVRVTAIDVSEASLAYAREHCTALGIPNVNFIALDLRRVGDLGQRFDAISCTGVLHHLADPELGLSRLVGVLKPGGVIHIMVYSRLARLRVKALRSALQDLIGKSQDRQSLREIRRRLIAKFPKHYLASQDFFTLSV